MNTKLKGRDYFPAVIDAMTDLVRVLDCEGNVVLTNQAMETQLGSCIGKKCFECWGRDLPCETCVIHEVVETGKAVHAEREVKGRYYSVKAAPFRNQEGEIVGVVEVFRDITDIAAIRDRLLKVNAKMLKDLAMARRLQRAMIRRALPDIPGYTFHSGFYPCEAIGGDAFDCLPMADGKLLLYVADVSGHGVRSAMLTVFLRQELSFLAKMPGVDSNRILRELEQAFLELNTDESVYITLFMVIIDVETGEFSYVNAGHSVAPLLKNTAGVRKLHVPGAPICRWAQAGGEVHTDMLQPGDRLLLYTDGIIDIHAIERSEYELTEAFGKEPFSGEQFIHAIRNKFQHNFVDDLALLVCERDR